MASEQDFPRSPEAFKAWADRECVSWPEDLTRLAYNTRFDGFGAFAEAYAKYKAK